jgi:hypothetical protein
VSAAWPSGAKYAVTGRSSPSTSCSSVPGSAASTITYSTPAETEASNSPASARSSAGALVVSDAAPPPSSEEHAASAPAKSRQERSAAKRRERAVIGPGP